jgi:predicted DNA-binding transcriptional regulator
MIQVGLLTETQKDELVGQLYDSDSYFNPIQDIEDNWIISIEEIEQNINPNFTWVRDLPLIEFKPKPNPPLFI